MSSFGGPRHVDRAGSAPWLTWSLTIGVAVVVGIAVQSAARGELTPAAGFAAGFGIGAMAMAGLPSLSIRLIARLLVLVSAVVLVRFGLLGGSLTSGGQTVLAWLIAAVFVLVLADRVGNDAHAPLGAADAPGTRGSAGSSSPTDPAGSSRPSATIRTAAVAAGIVVLAAVLLAPVLLPYAGDAVEPGNGATLDPRVSGASILRSTDSLDMTSRPQLNDEVVMTVDTDRATFWRGETFDTWDGRTWTRSDPRFLPLASGDTPQLADDDLGARGSDVVEQRFRIAASYTDIMFAVPTAVQFQVDRPVRQRADGTLQVAPLGRGATYSVTSRRIPLTAERLRAVQGDIPDEIREQYAQPPVTTDRVREAATAATAGTTTQYDQVLALEAWMGDRVEYSLDAPLAPKGVDVVDHFLFDAEQGWCEQIASSLVVMARSNGIPARLVTGYVPDERDPVTGVFTVRQKDAHAWAEVWFPEVGWVPFDPTADVPLAGADRPEPTLVEWIQQHLIAIGVGVAALLLLAGPVRLLVRRIRARRAARPVGWPAVAGHRLEDLGARVGRPRLPHETATAYGGALAERYRDDRLAWVGRAIDDVLYAPHPPDAAVSAQVDAVLVELADAPVPEAEPVPTG